VGGGVSQSRERGRKTNDCNIQIRHHLYGTCSVGASHAGPRQPEMVYYYPLGKEGMNGVKGKIT